MKITSDSEFRKVLEHIWLTPQGLEATQDLKEGVVLEQYYENQYVVHARKTADGWEFKEGPIPTSKVMRLFYYGDGCEKLARTKDLTEFANAVQEVIAERKMVFIPMRPPETLVRHGFADFARRLGLPGK